MSDSAELTQIEVVHKDRRAAYAFARAAAWAAAPAGTKYEDVQVAGFEDLAGKEVSR